MYHNAEQEVDNALTVQQRTEKEKRANQLAAIFYAHVVNSARFA